MAIGVAAGSLAQYIVALGRRSWWFLVAVLLTIPALGMLWFWAMFAGVLPGSTAWIRTQIAGGFESLSENDLGNPVIHLVSDPRMFTVSYRETFDEQRFKREVIPGTVLTITVSVADLQQPEQTSRSVAVLDMRSSTTTYVSYDDLRVAHNREAVSLGAIAGVFALVTLSTWLLGLRSWRRRQQRALRHAHEP